MSADPGELRFRTAEPADAPRIAPVMAAGFATFRAFAPAGWEPPSEAAFADGIAVRLGHPGAWCRLAEDAAGVVAGYVALLPATDGRHPVPDPRLAHFWMLFVRAPWWGTGLAARLHADACAAAAERGYTAMRLFTPARQARARRFYEREGWTLSRDAELDPEIGFDVVEYRRPV